MIAVMPERCASWKDAVEHLQYQMQTIFYTLSPQDQADVLGQTEVSRHLLSSFIRESQKSDERIDELQRIKGHFMRLESRIARIESQLSQTNTIQQLSAFAGRLQQQEENLEKVGANTLQVEKRLQRLTDEVAQALTSSQAAHHSVAQAVESVGSLEAITVRSEADIKSFTAELQQVREQCMEFSMSSADEMSYRIVDVQAKVAVFSTEIEGMKSSQLTEKVTESILEKIELFAKDMAVIGSSMAKLQDYLVDTVDEVWRIREKLSAIEARYERQAEPTRKSAALYDWNRDTSSRDIISDIGLLSPDH